MKGLIRKEWYSLWSQYRIHMLAMLGLGVLLPIIKNTDFFPDESFWIYCAVITIFYILMHSVEYEKKSNWDMYRATFPINGREIVVSKYIFGFGIVIIASILVFAGSMICQKMIVGRINIYFIGRVVKSEIQWSGMADLITIAATYMGKAFQENIRSSLQIPFLRHIHICTKSEIQISYPMYR